LLPARQQRLGWALDTAIEQTGGYFYSRLLLMIVNATLGFGVLVAVRLPWLVALPLAIFQGFFAEFIPAVGTYNSPHDRPPVNGSRADPDRRTIFQRSRR
jgi:predicted PurR-regulated permease PerM